MRRVLSILIGFVFAATAAQAAEVQLTIRDGRVWLSAHDATPRQILTEWERVGHTRIVNGERLAGSPVSIELAGVPEQQALDVVLRSASGFMAVQRDAIAMEASAASTFDRILILPTSVAPPDTRPAAAAGSATFAQPGPPQFAPPAPPQAVYPGGVRRVIGADGQPVPDDQEGVPPPMPAAPQPQQASPYTTPGMVPPAQPGQQPATPAVAPPSRVPTAPSGGVAVPGMVAPAPAQPGQPGQPQQPGVPQSGQPPVPR